MVHFELEFTPLILKETRQFNIILNSFLILSQQAAFARSPAAALQENSAHLLSNVAKD